MENAREDMKTRNGADKRWRRCIEDYLVVVGLVIAIVYWFTESALDSFLFGRGPFGSRLFPVQDPNELWMRLIIFLLFVVFSLFAHSLISRRRRIEVALRKEHNFVTSILDTIGALVIILDREGRITGFNRACEQTTGYTFSEVKDRHFWDIFLVDEEMETVKAVFKELNSGTPSKFENQWKKKDGGLCLIEWSNTVITDAGGSVEYIISAGTDITERRRLEREWKNLLSMFAHDMKNPVTACSGFLSRLLAGKAGPLEEKQLSYLGIIREEISVLEKLIADFLEFSKLESMEYRPALSPVNIKTALYKNVEIAMMAAEKKRMEILLEISEDAPEVIQADALLLDRVVNNLLDNAVKYSNPGGTVSVRLSDKGAHVLVQIADSGIGISEEHLPHIFDTFYRVSRDARGSGLGLSIVKKIVEAHGGRIWAASTKGKGSTFSFTLPK
jgi:PAS domain S-box-containing protein